MSRQYADGQRVYIVYESRAASGDPDDVFDAAVLVSFDAASDGKAKQIAYRDWHHLPYVLYGHTFKDGQAIQDEAPLKKHWC